MNRRQWRHRVYHCLRWKCNVPLVRLDHVFASRCPLCGTQYPETVRRSYERACRISIDGFGKEFWMGAL